jgi:hypothetical protein
MLEAQPTVDPHITFNAICSKSAAKILALVAVVIGDGPGVILPRTGYSPASAWASFAQLMSFRGPSEARQSGTHDTGLWKTGSGLPLRGAPE